MATDNNITKTEMASLSSDVDRLRKEIDNVFGDDEKSKGEFISEIEAFVKDPRIETKKSGVNRLEQILSSNKNLGSNSSVQVTAKKFYLAVDKIIEQHSGEVKELREDNFKENFNKELIEKNSKIDELQLKNAQEYRDLVAKNSFDKSIIDGQQNIALENNEPLFGPGKIENAWMDLKTTVNFLQKSPEEIKNIKEKYNSLKGKLDGVNLPTGSKEARSFERMMGGLNKPNVDDLFSKARKYLGWADRVDKMTGGWLNKTVTDAGVKVFEKIGNQAIQEFTTNALGQMAQHGFQQGFSNVLNGILSGGVQATATTTASGVGTGIAVGGTAAATATGAAAGGTAAATGAAAASAVVPGIGWIVAAAIVALGAIKKIGNTIAEKLGISSKAFFEDNFGKVGGFFVKAAMGLVALPAMLIGLMSATLIGPIIIAVVIGLFGYQLFQGSLVSSLVPPKGTDSTTIEIPTAGGGNINLPPVTGSVDGQKIVTMARSLIGNICYYWAGGHNSNEPVLGVDPRWGKQVSRDKKGASIYGLDCSGFVAWVFHQYGILNTNAGAREMIFSLPAAKRFTNPNLLQIGDIGYGSSPSDHIGIYSGRDANGNPLWVHSTSRPTNGGAGNNFCRKNNGEVYGGVHESTYSEFNIFARL